MPNRKEKFRATSDDVLKEFSDITNSNDDDEELDKGETDSCTSFSLQECINEFRARRMRRLSTQGKETERSDDRPNNDDEEDLCDADLINQNRTNKEQERKCKPCKNGFCYCFTSDSGDSCLSASQAARAMHVRHNKRNRRSEFNQPDTNAQHNGFVPEKDVRRKSAPANLKPTSTTAHSPADTKKVDLSIAPDQNGNMLSAISRLETSGNDAPLIHIIQELHNNCVISEVRVNREKLSGYRSQNSSPRKAPIRPRELREPTAPPLDLQTTPRKAKTTSIPQQSPGKLNKILELNSATSQEDGSVVSTHLESTADSSQERRRRRSKLGGRLLQKRLSQCGHVQVTQHDPKMPPPKPPRGSSASIEDKVSMVSIPSTSPSIREAERILDDFLKRNGVVIPKSGKRNTIADTAGHSKTKRNSYPISNEQRSLPLEGILPTCPSLSDIERVDTEKSNYHNEKNTMQQSNKEKHFAFGWKEPIVSEMLNYDKKEAQSQKFESHQKSAEPQSKMGWCDPSKVMPHKIALDMVDGTVKHNLASNISAKNTPTKSRILTANSKESSPLAMPAYNISWRQQWQGTKKKFKTPCNLLNNSRKKLLRLVTPKKNNKKAWSFKAPQRKTPYRNIAVQTSPEELVNLDLNLSLQSPPGSYHSPIQTSTQSTNLTSATMQSPKSRQYDGNQSFDFSRTVKSPPRKAPRTASGSQRKLDFRLDSRQRTSPSCCVPSNDHSREEIVGTKTYRSYHSDLDQDVTLSKMGFILSNIRARLEASDNYAVRTFQDSAIREHQCQQSQQSTGFDCVDFSLTSSSSSTRPQFNRPLSHSVRHNVPQTIHEQDSHEPIYSEIEEDSIHISESTDFDSKVEARQCNLSSRDNKSKEALYAKVNKPKRDLNAQSKVVKDADHKYYHRFTIDYGNDKNLTNDSIETESTTSSYRRMSSENVETDNRFASKMPHCQSLNNIRVNEYNSPPKRNRNLSKSDLSLQRSQVFLENLCRSELVGTADGHLERLEKVENASMDRSCTSLRSLPPPPVSLNLDVSYELPNDAATDEESIDNDELVFAENNAKNHSSTPKKPNEYKTYVSECDAKGKEENKTLESTLIAPNAQTFEDTSRIIITTPPTLRQATVERTTFHNTVRSNSMEEIPSYSGNHDVSLNTNGNSIKAIATHYEKFKSALQKSFRQTKIFIKSDKRRLSQSLSFSSYDKSPSELAADNATKQPSEIAINLDVFLDNGAPLAEQLAKVVSICRQIPILEMSPEMAEAERLLLYSFMQEQQTQATSLGPQARSGEDDCKERQRNLKVDAMRLQLKTDISNATYYNYYYFVTFECGGAVKSTQSVECRKQEVVFQNCNIEFNYNVHQIEPVINCKIFMLRLRKITANDDASGLHVTPLPADLGAPSLNTRLSSSSSSGGYDIVSRFRLQAEFCIQARDFAPYDYDESGSSFRDVLQLRSMKLNCFIPLMKCSKTTNLINGVLLSVRSQVYFPKQCFEGFLHVQDPHTQHNWNRRWCRLDGLKVSIWPDSNRVNDERPLLQLDLRGYNQSLPLTESPRELCARARSFCLQCTTFKAGEEIDSELAAVFFAADTQDDMRMWLETLNAVLDFIKIWMKS